MPNRLDRSVTASATCLSLAAALTTSSIRTRPSTIEYSECTRKCTNPGPCGACCKECGTPAGTPASCITISILSTNPAKFNRVYSTASQPPPTDAERRGRQEIMPGRVDPARPVAWQYVQRWVSPPDCQAYNIGCSV